VLASDEDGGTLEALKFSLATDIVELLVLTTDAAFLQTLRAAVGGTRRLWHVLSADKMSDLLVAGEVGIVVLDAPALHEAAGVFVRQIKRQFPDLVVVAAGHRDHENSLAGLISAGLVYRFIHKPMSPGRAKLFAEAAIRKYEQQRRRAAEAPQRRRASPSTRWLVAAALAALVGAVAWMAQRSGGDDAAFSPVGEPAKPTPAQLPSADANARTGLTEINERLLARAENALLEERLDEAAAALETARKSGVEGSRIAFLTAQLAKSREQAKSAKALAQPRAQARAEPKTEVEPKAKAEPKTEIEPKAEAEPKAKAAPKTEQDPTPLLSLATERMADGSLLEPDRDSARKQVDVDAWGQLLKNANERLLQDRLIEPANDNAKYFYLTLKQIDPGNAALSSVLQDLGTRLAGKARGALILGQYDAAKSWLDEAGAIGFTSAEVSSAQHDLESALAKQNFMTNLAPANQLTLLKSVQPVYPSRAAGKKLEGWVDVEFTVSEAGKVQDIAVRATSVPGVFEDAAVKAVSQWRYRPIVRDAGAVPVRTQIRIRFTLS